LYTLGSEKEYCINALENIGDYKLLINYFGNSHYHFYCLSAWFCGHI